jgi:hypothetical protein
MNNGTRLAMAVIGLMLMPQATPAFRADIGIVLSIVNAPVASHSQRIPPSAPASAYGMDVPLAYCDLSFTLSKRTGGITPPVQARNFA